PAVHHWHHEVEQDQARGGLGAQVLERLLPVRDPDGAVTLVRQELAKALADPFVVVDDQDPMPPLVHRAEYPSEPSATARCAVGDPTLRTPDPGSTGAGCGRARAGSGSRSASRPARSGRGPGTRGRGA